MYTMVIYMDFFNNDSKKLKLTNLLFSSTKTGNRPFYIYIFCPYNDIIANEISKITSKDLGNLSHRPGFVQANTDNKYTDTCTALFYQIEIIPDRSTNITINKTYNGHYPTNIYVYIDLPPRSANASTNILKFDATTSSINNISEMIF